MNYLRPDEANKAARVFEDAHYALRETEFHAVGAPCAATPTHLAQYRDVPVSWCSVGTQTSFASLGKVAMDEGSTGRARGSTSLMTLNALQKGSQDLR